MNLTTFSDFLIKRVVLRTSDATRLAEFYQDLLGLMPQQTTNNLPSISLHHPLSSTALITILEDSNSRPAPQGAPGLFHVAFLFPDLNDWRSTVKRAIALTHGRYGASDHGVSWAAYLSDPDGNGIELAWDKPSIEWLWHGDQIQMVTRTLPLRGILENPDLDSNPSGVFGIGHLHLQVSDLNVTTIYQEHLGLRITQADYPGARFLARGNYHHHFAVNTWGTHPRISRPENATGLVGWEMAQSVGLETHPWRDPYNHHVTLD